MSPTSTELMLHLYLRLTAAEIVPAATEAHEVADVPAAVAGRRVVAADVVVVAMVAVVGTVVGTADMAVVAGAIRIDVP
jgi:hypothetical protein